MEFKLGDKVKCKQSNTPMYGNTPACKGVITGVFNYNGNINGEVFYQVRTDTNALYNYPKTAVTPIKVQVLHAYIDTTEEVHWATKNYTEKELKEFGLKRAPEFNKSIDLE